MGPQPPGLPTRFSPSPILSPQEPHCFRIGERENQPPVVLLCDSHHTPPAVHVVLHPPQLPVCFLSRQNRGCSHQMDVDDEISNQKSGDIAEDAIKPAPHRTCCCVTLVGASPNVSSYLFGRSQSTPSPPSPSP